MAPNPSMEVIKLQEVIDDGDGSDGVGDLVKYTITVENTGNIDLTGLTVSDVLSDITESNTIYDSASPNSDVFFDGPYYIGSDDGASVGNLAVGDTATYLVFYRLTQDDVDAGGISNSATATATSSEGNITDISDDGDTVTCLLYTSPSPRDED